MDHHFKERIAALLAAIEADPGSRLDLQPTLHRLIEDLDHASVPVPARLRDLDRQLRDEADEDGFDNFPV